MNFFGRKNKNSSSNSTTSFQFTSSTEAVVSTRPSPPPASAFGSHHTSTIELAATTTTPPTTNKSYDQTMQELSDFQIDSDDDGFDDVEFRDTLVTNATAHIQREQRTQRKTATIWTIAGVVIVGLCVGLVAVVVFSGAGGGGNNNTTAASTTRESSFDSTISPASTTVPQPMTIDNATFLNETLSNEIIFVNMTDIVLNEEP
mmetsp:Transcript_13382/g.22155  ORF Transcript_13382/g.22155 Transcript_13382/m.22155 type:complete len:203 (-) Transcript_13382:165-773(-)|eukprot:CAMPEP_0119003364 /NCGR_PEP_ID=MMETSP1176-20130426/519_1 /TAXON_ID=265551 /ORGANISM="Synedropsis recta cf, Strain CCMP1620" /LENGTH=202 /DNA_ID=CAMNT_0006954961 /DNA_START=144 /DNA_END=752 /DNA_ORIENTATION=-